MRNCVIDVINFLQERGLLTTQMFNSKNICGDTMETIYNKNGIVIEYCWKYDYLEIFGLTDEEFNLVSLNRYIEELNYQKYSAECFTRDMIKNLSDEQFCTLLDVASKTLGTHCDIDYLLYHLNITDDNIIKEIKGCEDDD